MYFLPGAIGRWLFSRIWRHVTWPKLVSVAWNIEKKWVKQSVHMVSVIARMVSSACLLACDAVSKNLCKPRESRREPINMKNVIYERDGYRLLYLLWHRFGVFLMVNMVWIFAPLVFAPWLGGEGALPALASVVLLWSSREERTNEREKTDPQIGIEI